MKAYPVRQQEPKKGPIRKQIKICVNCGSTNVQEYKFGISCNRCGTCFYFGRTYW